MKGWRVVLSVLAVTFVAGMAGASRLAAQDLVGVESLPQVARQERERRALVAKEYRKPIETYTGRDLVALTRLEGRAHVGTFTSVRTSATPSGAAEAATEKSLDEVYWQERLESAQHVVERAQREVSDLEPAVREAQRTPLSTVYDDAVEEAAQRQQLFDQYASAKQDVADAERALAEVEQEAQQRAGA